MDADLISQRSAAPLRALARRGEMTGMTRVDDPYEPPEVLDALRAEGIL